MNTTTLRPLLPLTQPELSMDDHRALAGSSLDTARRELIAAMRHLDATETREVHLRAGLAVALLDDALAGLARQS